MGFFDKLINKKNENFRGSPNQQIKEGEMPLKPQSSSFIPVQSEAGYCSQSPKYNDNSTAKNHICAFCGKEIFGKPQIKNRHWWCGNCVSHPKEGQREKKRQNPEAISNKKEAALKSQPPEYSDNSKVKNHICAFCGNEIFGKPQVKDRHWWCGNCFSRSKEGQGTKKNQSSEEIENKTNREERKQQEIIKISDFTNFLGIQFMRIPYGEFDIGSNIAADEKPVHKVNISKSFYLGKYPVTQKEWITVMENNPSNFKGYNRPVEYVSWNEVQEFIKKLNALDGTSNYRLPSEAEWEYACRAGTSTRYSFSDDESKLGEYAWYIANSEKQTQPVGLKKSNLFGLHDMHGNVLEWVQDKWHDNYTEAPNDGCAWEYANTSSRVLRGGSWIKNSNDCRSASRSSCQQSYRGHDIGFRLVREISDNEWETEKKKIIEEERRHLQEERLKSEKEEAESKLKKEVSTIIQNSDELFEKTKSLNISLDGILLNQAKKAFKSGDYLLAIDLGKQFYDLLIQKHKNESESRIRDLKELIEKAKAYGLNPDEKYIKFAKNLFENAEYVKCLEQCSISKDLLQKMLQDKESKTRDILNNSEQLLEKAKGYKLNPNESLLEQAQIAFKKSDYLATIKHCDEFEKNIHALIQNKERETSDILKKSEELLEKARGYGLTPDETHLKQAKDSFANLDYLKAIQYSELFENALKQKILEIEKEAKKALEQSRELIEKTRAQGITPDEKYLNEANDFFSRPNYTKTIQLCQQSDTHVNQLIQDKQTEAQDKLKISEQLMEKAQKLSLDPGMQVFESIKESYSQSILGLTIENADAFIKSTEFMLQENVASLTLDFSIEPLKPNAGKKINAVLRNQGKVIAENIILNITGEAECRLPSMISDLNPGDQAELQIWIKPKLEGDLPLDIVLEFTDAIDRKYKIEDEIWLEVTDRPYTTTNDNSNALKNKDNSADFFSSPRSSSSLPEEIANQYSKVLFVGKGGFARVFCATNRNGNAVALKLPLNLDPATGKSFVKEIAVWQRFNHENIIKIYDLNVLPFPYIEMEYAEKGSLNDIRKPMDVETASKIIFDVSEGLKHAHENGIIHRDLKPHNILLTSDMIPKITDWGLSKVMTQSTSSHSVGYTPIYASPEQLSPKKFGTPDIRTDIYQLGVIFYELVTGKLPFEGDDFSEIGFAILSEDPNSPSSCVSSCSELDNIILKCLEKKPVDRYQNMQEFQTDLASYLKKEYSKSLKMSAGDLRRSCIYCGDLVLINAKIGDAENALKYALNMKDYASGNYIEQVEDIIKKLDYVAERRIVIGDELISKIKILMHQVKMGR